MSTFLKTSLIIIISILQIQAQDMDYCRLYSKGEGYLWNSASIYCCKNCCLDTFSAASQCTEDKCKGCEPGYQGVCQNNYDSLNKKFYTTGCSADSEFCKYKPAVIENTFGFDVGLENTTYNGTYGCAVKLNNSQECENDLQC